MVPPPRCAPAICSTRSIRNPESAGKSTVLHPAAESFSWYLTPNVSPVVCSQQTDAATPPSNPQRQRLLLLLARCPAGNIHRYRL